MSDDKADLIRNTVLTDVYNKIDELLSALANENKMTYPEILMTIELLKMKTYAHYINQATQITVKNEIKSEIDKYNNNTNDSVYG